MRQSVRLAQQCGVAVGAHPSFPDREGFGRRVLSLTPAQIGESVRGQLWALQQVARDEGATLTHVKPHGALYNVAAQNRAVAQAIAQAIAESGIGACYGLAGECELLRAAQELGLRAIGEGFADRGYDHTGKLWPRGQAGDLLPHAEAVAQGVRIALEGQVTAVTGEIVPVAAQTLCVHGDGAEAAATIRDLRQALEAAGVRIASALSQA